MGQSITKGAQSIASLEDSAAQGDMKAKRELARRLVEGDGVDKDETKAVSLLEDCVGHGDTVAMVMLAKCCALARGMEHNVGRAEALLSDAAEKGKHEARVLLQLINDCKGKERVDLRCLQKCFLNELQREKLIFVLFLQGVSRENAR